MLGHFDRLGFFLLGICIVLVILHFIFQATQNKPYHNVEHFENLQEPIYIFWTGGFDSTFRVLQALIDEGQVVQPVYISAIIDNLSSSNTRRNNTTQELKAISKIESNIRHKFPEISHRLLPTQIVSKIDISPNVEQAMKVLYKKRMVRRPVCQYGALAQYSLNINKPIELSVVKGDFFQKSIQDKVSYPMEDKLRLDIMEKEPELKIFQNLRFPIIKLLKKDLVSISKKSNFLDSLKDSWSCWYPINGKPCGRCIMCQERII